MSLSKQERIRNYQTMPIDELSAVTEQLRDVYAATVEGGNPLSPDAIAAKRHYTEAFDVLDARTNSGHRV